MESTREGSCSKKTVPFKENPRNIFTHLPPHVSGKVKVLRRFSGTCRWIFIKYSVEPEDRIGVWMVVRQGFICSTTTNPLACTAGNQPKQKGMLLSLICYIRSMFNVWGLFRPSINLLNKKLGSAVVL